LVDSYGLEHLFDLRVSKVRVRAKRPVGSIPDRRHFGRVWAVVFGVNCTA
jgi:hypothetical protein